MTPGLIVNATLAWFVLENNKLDAATAFTIISLFSVLQEPLRSIPKIITMVIET